MSTTTRHHHRSGLDASLEKWRNAGLIDPAQAEAIRRFDDMSEPAPTGTSTRKVPFVAEALGYLGGMLGIIGSVALGARYWSDMSTALRMTIGVAALAVFVVGGALVPRRGDAALERLRAFLWTGATASAALVGGVFTGDVLGVEGVDDASALVLGMAVPATLVSLALWWGRERPVQEALCFAGLLIVTGTFVAQFASTAVAGLFVWAIAAILLWSGIGHLTPTPVVAVAIGSLGTMVGAAMTTDAEHGASLLFWTGTVLALLALAGLEVPVRTTMDRVTLLVTAVLFGLQAVPRTILWFGHDAGLATGAAIWCIGLLVLAASTRPWVRSEVLTQIAGGSLLVMGAAVTGMQSVAVATITGLCVAVGLIVLGTVPGYAVLSVLGCAGLLINVPWAISHFFPGEGRAPLLIAVCGLLLVLVAVWLSHQGGQLRHQFGGRRG